MHDATSRLIGRFVLCCLFAAITDGCASATVTPTQ